MDLPLELIEQYQKGRLLVVIGQGINGSEWAQLGQVLADRLGTEQVTGARITEELAELYEARFGRQALVQFVLDFYSLAGGPNKAHGLLARLRNCRFFVTTCVDERLEEAFRVIGRPVHSIIRRTDLAYTTAYTARLYRPYGKLSQPECLRLTQDETADALSLLQEGGFSDVLKGHLADSTIVFVGFNLDDGFFKQLYRSSIKPLHRHNPRSYAFAEQDYSELTRWFCKQNNIEILKASLADILAAFVQTLERQVTDDQQVEPIRIDHSSELLRKQPYKRLFSYGPEDGSIFFGRREESEQLLSLVYANQLVILYGDSGVGKSSLLGASLIPALEGGDYTVVLERVLESPTAVLRRRLTHGISETLNGESLVSLLVAVTQERSIVIILDQFEEFFTRLNRTDQGAFISELAQVLARRDLPVKWVLSLRSEYLARLNDLRPAIPDIFKAEYYLAPLSLEAAAQAIRGPASVVGLSVEPELIQMVVSDLGPDGWVEPPQLQIICYELYQSVRAKEDNTLRLKYYNDRGGAREILGDYLEQSLRHLPSPTNVHARQVLIALVSGEGTPALISLEEVASAARLAVEETAELLTRLQDEWLVKSTLYDGIQVYELAHAYLADSLAVDSDILQRKAIEELLRRNLQDWQRYRILLSVEELQTLRNWVEKIDLPLEAQKLLLRSAIQRNHDLPNWLERVDTDIVPPILKEFFVGGETIEPQPQTALNAMRFLPQREPFIDELCNLLDRPSLSSEIRQQAAIYLALISPTLVLKTLRRSHTDVHHENWKTLIYLYNAEASGIVTLGQPPTWPERGAILASRFRSNAGYIAARTGTAGLAAIVGGLLGSITGLGTIRGDYFFYLFGAAFVPFVWATGLMLGLTLVEALRFSQRPSTWFMGAILGNLPLVLLVTVDPDPNLALQGLIYGILGAILSGTILAATLTLTGRLASPGWRVLLSVAGGAFAGLAYSLVLSPLATATGIPGFNQWILAAILAGGAASMMLGLFLVPAPPFAYVEYGPSLPGS